MRVLLALGVLLWPSLVSAQTITFDQYHSLADIDRYLQEVVEAYPDLATYETIGRSQRGREITVLILGIEHKLRDKPVIYLNGTHHGDEKSSTESILGIVSYITENQTDPFVTQLLQTYDLLLQPVVNPDGHVANSRSDARGRDPNRDYAYPERDEEASFALPEIAAIRDYTQDRQVVAAAAYHSGMEGVLWPWCYSGNATADHAVMREMSRRFAEGMDMSLYRQSYYDYPTRGEFVDYLYWKQGTLAVTVEVSNAHTPPVRQLASYVDRALAGTLEFLNAVVEYGEGRLLTHPSFDDRTLALN